MTREDPTLPQLHRTILVRLSAALSNVRLLAVGAPFVEGFTGLLEQDLLDAMEAARVADQLSCELARRLGPNGVN
jgi:hypothetical protein